MGEHVNTVWQNVIERRHRHLRHRDVDAVRRHDAVPGLVERRRRRRSPWSRCPRTPARVPRLGRREWRCAPSGIFAELLKRPVCAGNIRNRLGRLTDLVFAPAEPYPEVVGIYIEHGWGKPTEFVPWDRVVKIEDDAIFVQRPEGGSYPPFVDQPGWIMVDNHLMGRTILDMDGRRIEVVNDVHLLELQGPARR